MAEAGAGEDDARGPLQRVESRIHVVRGARVMLSTDLAVLYGVEPRVLVQAVARNAARFPDDFCFQMTRDELANLKSRIVISSWGGARTPPYAFTEQGVAMLSSVLRSPRAIAVNIEIVRAFVLLRSMLESHRDTNEGLAGRLADLEQRYDEQFRAVFDAIRDLMTPLEPSPKKRIGFIQNDD